MAAVERAGQVIGDRLPLEGAYARLQHEHAARGRDDDRQEKNENGHTYGCRQRAEHGGASSSDVPDSRTEPAASSVMVRHESATTS